MATLELNPDFDGMIGKKVDPPPIEFACEDAGASADVGMLIFSPIVIQYRAYLRFNITALDPADTVTKVELIFYVWVSGQATHTCAYSPYGGGYGTRDPEADPCSSAGRWFYTRPPYPYITGDISFRTTGWKTVDLGAGAAAYLMLARDAGTVWSLSLCEEGDDAIAGAIYTTNHATLKPYIRITYTPAVPPAIHKQQILKPLHGAL